MLPADIVAVRFGDRANRHLPDLRASAHDDDPLAIDSLQALDYGDTVDNRQLLQVGCKLRKLGRQLNFKIDAGVRRPVVDDGDGNDIALMLRDHAREAVK